MKILIVNDGFPPAQWGGAHTIAHLHVQGLQARGHEVRTFSGAAFGTYHPRWWAWVSLYNPGALRAFKKEVAAFKPDVVHFHNIHHAVSYHAIAVAKGSGARVCLTAHDVMSFAYRKLRPGPYRVSWVQNLADARKRFNPFRNVIIRWYLRKVDTIFAVSDALKEALAANGIRGNVVVVHNGLPVPSNRCPFPPEPTALFVGRFTPDKGRDALLEAFAVALQSVPQAKLLVVGAEPEPSLEALVEKLTLRSHIELVPPVLYGEIPQYYCRATVVVVPSVVFDSFPTINLEAAAAHRPSIATSFGGSREFVEDGVSGYVVDPRDIALLAERLVALLGDQPLAMRMGDAAHQRLAAHFSLDQQIAAYERSYLSAR